MTATIHDFEVEKSARMRPFRLGTLELEGARIKLVADCRLTPSAARTLAAQLIVMAESITGAVR